METEYKNSYNTENSNSPELQQAKLLFKHEKEIKKGENQYNLESKTQDLLHQKEIFEKELGYIGRLFGNSEHASKNITATICLSLIIGTSIISFFVYWCRNDVEFVKNIWEKVMPVITLSLGYLFGKN